MDADRYDDEVVRLYESLLTAWNQRDGGAMGATFADDGEMIGFDGTQVTGRSEIASEMNRIFADHETASSVWKVRSARALGSGLALLRAVAGMVPPGQSDIYPDPIRTTPSWPPRAMTRVGSFSSRTRPCFPPPT